MAESTILQVGLMAAQALIEDALVSGDSEEKKTLGIRAINCILETHREMTIRGHRCANPSCTRTIRDADPIFLGYCSTMCRESYHSRVLQTVHAKFAASTAAANA